MNRRMSDRFVSETGSVAIYVLFVTLIVGLLAVSMTTSATIDLDAAANYRSRSRAFLGADSVVQAYFHEVLVISRQLGRFPTQAELDAISPVTPPDIEILEIDAEQQGDAVVEPVTTGLYQGLYASTARFEATVSARDVDPPHGSATVSMVVDLDLIPLFQFLAFFEQDLVVSPLPVMNLNGRIHTNSDMWLAASNEVNLLAPATAVGRVYNATKRGRGSARGDVNIRDADGNLVPMAGLDSTDPDWEDASLERWDGNIHSGEHGVERLQPAISQPGNPRVLIEPGYTTDNAGQREDKLYYGADVRVINGRFFNSAGTEFFPADVKGNSPLRFTTIYDVREKRPMLTMEVNIEVLEDAGAFPSNGLLYVGGFAPGGGLPSWPRDVCSCWGPEEWESFVPEHLGGDGMFATKITGGKKLPDALTVVSENSLYVRGNYNGPGNGGKKAAAFMADSVTILSENWGRRNSSGTVSGSDPDDDWGYSNLSMSSRKAKNTAVHAAMLVGSQEDAPQNYNGGLENLPKFMEDWRSAKFTYLGSMVHLWWSQHTLGNWVYSPVYQAPTRDWSFDDDFLLPENLPVATPVVASMRFIGWDSR